MPRFFVEQEIVSEADHIVLNSDDSHHIVNVLRLRPGEKIEVCDSHHTLFLCAMPERVSVDRRALVVPILSRRPADTEPPYEAVLYQGLPKGDKFSDIVRTCVELGVFRIVPVICERSVARPDPGKIDARVRRWNSVAVAAAKQCGRSLLPSVERALTFEAALADFAAARDDQTLAFVPYEAEDSVSLRHFLENGERKKQFAVPPRRICFFVGPEGGFSAAEIDQFRELGFSTVTLGPRILRTETAGSAALAMLGYKFEQDWSII